METANIPETFYPKTSDEWRNWLKANADKQSIWLLQYKQSSGKPSLSWSDAVDEALCYGWIDSTRKSIDHERFIQLFTKRKPTSVWSKINKDKVAMLISEGRMTEAGLLTIEKAKQNGSWTILDEVEQLIVPADLEKAFASKPAAGKYFSELSKSRKKMILQWITLAKRSQTRQKRISEVADLAAQGKLPKQFM